VAAQQREFAVRRERMALRAHIPHTASPPIEIDLGNFVGLQVETTLWVSATPLVSTESRTSALAAVLAWQARSESINGAVTHIKICDATTPGFTARRASYFSLPIEVLDTRNGGRTIATPALHEPVVQAHPEHLALAEMFHNAGADVVVEHGVVAGEVAGLEVARVIDEQGVPRVRIGVGTHDREMFKMLHGDAATGDQLGGVVQTVLQHRRPGAPTHPLNLLAVERAMRSQAIASPATLGLQTLQVAEPPVARKNLKDAEPCCAVGTDHSGAAVVVVFMAGIDLDVVPFAADARDRLSPRGRLIIAAAQRNIVPLQTRVAELLTQPAQFVSA